jgi:hypothetical protein
MKLRQYLNEQKFYRNINSTSDAVKKMKELKIPFEFYQSKTKGGSIYFYDNKNREIAYYAIPTDTLSINRNPDTEFTGKQIQSILRNTTA